MLGFINSWFGPPANPIGVDFGSESLKMAQVQVTGGEHRLIAAASADVPSHARTDPQARAAFFAHTARDLLAQGAFRGRAAVLALPAASMFIQHLRIPRLDDEATRKALVWEARGKLPIDPNHALMRHVVAGEIYEDQEPKNEIILMAAAREMVNQFLGAAGRAKLDVVGMNVEPLAVVNCFAHVYRRKADADLTSCYVDIGAAGTRAFVARGAQLLFARSIPVGGNHFARATAAALGVNIEDAKLMRMRLASMQPSATDREERHAVQPEARAAAGADVDNSFALLGAGLAAAEKRAGAGTAVAPAAKAAAAGRPRGATMTVEEELARVDVACQEPLAKLIDELDLCRRYYEATFPQKPVDRLIFIGGEARNRALCQRIAQQMGLAAQVGDPLVRMGRTTDVGVESGIDRRQPQPGWTVAIGLSLGPLAGGGGSDTPATGR